MPELVDLLVLAFYLSVLTYYLGVLIYMLPIPIYGVKRWAPQLMVDGIFSAILVFSYSTIQWVVKYVSGLIGADWSEYYNWFLGEVNIVIGSIAALKVIGVGLSSMGLSFLANSLISPLVSSLTYLLMFLATATLFVTIITSISSTLLAIGILLHALPFRIARASGATLIAIVIVFSIGTPLLPQFVNSIAPQSPQKGLTSYNYLLADIYVYDATGDPVSYYLYEVYSFDNTLLARYLADLNGVIRASLVDKGLPCSRYKAVIDLAGYKYETIVDPPECTYSIRSTNISHILDNLIVIKPLRFIAVFNYKSLEIYRKEEYNISLAINAVEKIVLLVVSLSKDSINVSINGTLIEPSEKTTYSWGGLSFSAYIYPIEYGYHRVEVRFDLGVYDSVEPSFSEIYYARDTLGLTIEEPLSLIYPVSSLIFRLFIAPVIYFSIMFSASLALSRMLGGSSAKIARLLVSAG